MKLYTIEAKRVAGKSYISIKLVNVVDLPIVKNVVELLENVLKVNITKNSEDGDRLTVYPIDKNRIRELCSQIDISLKIFYSDAYLLKLVQHTNVFKILNEYPRVLNILTKGIQGIAIDDKRHVLDDMRNVIEQLYRKLLNNNKSLENQKEEIQRFLNNQGIDGDLRHSLTSLISAYCKYQNDYVKHADGQDITENAYHFILEFSLFLIKASSYLKK